MQAAPSGGLEGWRRTMAGTLTLGVAALGFASLPAPADAAISFERCQGEGAEDWECARHTVPLDWSGGTPGTIDLEVRRYRPEGSPDPSGKLPFVGLAGGPGESATAAQEVLREAFGGALSSYQLIVFDQRGTGLSGALSCPVFSGEEGDEEEDPLQDIAELPRKQTARCGEQLGEKRAFYTTLDSARDIDSIRAGLEAPRIGIGGVSYGTYVAALYAQQLPSRVDRMVLDSVIRPTGWDPYRRETFQAVPRVVSEQCEADACKKATPSPLGDLRRVVGTAGENAQSQVFLALQAGDLNPFLRGGQPAAIRAAAKGDDAPLERFLNFAGVAGDGAGANDGRRPRQVPPEVRADSLALRVATVCGELEFPWPQSLPPGEERDRIFRNALAAIPAGSLFPFGRPAVRGTTWASQCLRWPLTDSAPRPEHPPFPDVPTFVVNGTADLRTPQENAIAAAIDFAVDAELVLVEGYGHSVLANSECARSAVERFFADQPVGDPCADADEWYAPEPLAPRSLGEVRRPKGTEGRRGRTMGAVLATTNDLIWVLDVKGGSFEVEGLRDGKVSFDVEKSRFRLDELSYVPGLKLSGALELRSRGRLVGTVRVEGKSAADGRARYRRNEKVTGRLGGERVTVRNKQ